MRCFLGIKRFSSQQVFQCLGEKDFWRFKILLERDISEFMENSAKYNQMNDYIKKNENSFLNDKIQNIIQINQWLRQITPILAKQNKQNTLNEINEKLFTFYNDKNIITRTEDFLWDQNNYQSQKSHTQLIPIYNNILSVNNSILFAILEKISDVKDVNLKINRILDINLEILRRTSGLSINRSLTNTLIATLVFFLKFNQKRSQHQELKIFNSFHQWEYINQYLDFLIQYLPLLQSNHLQYFGFFLSQNNVSKVSIKKYNFYWSTLLDHVSSDEKYFESMNLNQKKALIQSFGKNGFINQKMKLILEKEIENIKDIHKTPQFFQYFIVLCESFFNLHIINKESFNSKLSQYLYVFLDDTNQKPMDFMENLLLMGKFLVKLQYFEKDFWEIYLKNLNQMIKIIPSQQYQVYLTLHTIILFQDEIKDQKLQSKISAMNTEMQSFLNKSQSYFKSAFIVDKDLGNLLEVQFIDMLKAAQIPFVREHQIKCYEIDFWIPEHEIIIEINGPHHFLKPDYEKYNQSTEFRQMFLKKLGYDIIHLNFNSVQKENINFEQNFLKQYQEIIKNKKKL